MALSTGTRLGPYEVVALIGAGGMGEVYRARDTKLNRDVALKVLPDLFANDPERLARFRREAQVLASLNHPNIAHIHGLEESNGILALVMELVEGPTLADLLANVGRVLSDPPRGDRTPGPKGPGLHAEGGGLGIEEVLPIAKQMADALEAAHEQGVTHRDLKPANIKVRDDGMVKVLDFGLAKLAASETRGAGAMALSQSPTLTTPAATLAGVILGTAAYMSPEQARGMSVDKRTDIWAFGCVLYEMLTGRQTFSGNTISDTLAAVLRAEPDWPSLPAATPIAVRRLLRRSLEKDTKRRLQHIGDARLELDEPDAAEARPTDARPRRRVWPLVAATGVGAAIVGFVAWMLAPPPTAAPVTRFTIPIPASAPLPSTIGASIALSPDGRTLVYVGGNPPALMKRQLDGLGFEPVRGAEIGTAPFFSPDSAWIGFYAGGKLKKVPVDGGLAVTICDVPPIAGAGSTPGATWGDDGTIVVAHGDLYKVAASGGILELILKPDNEGIFAQPRFLPGSKAVLVRRGTLTAGRIEAIELQTRARHPLVEGTTPQFTATGDLLFERRGGIWAVGFDAKRLEVVGTPVPVVESVRTVFGQPVFSTARDGSLAYLAGDAGAAASMFWIDRAGKSTRALEAQREFQSPRLSPDGKSVVVSVSDGSRLDLWSYEFERGTRLRLTTTGRNRRTVWSPDGKRIAFYSTLQDGGDQDLFVMPSTGGEPTRLLARPGPQYPDTWSPDGRFIVFEESAAGVGVGRDLWLLPLGEAPRPLLVTRFHERGAVCSPDGRWLAFVTDEPGRAEVYVQPFPGPGPKVPISANGGLQPMWSRDGRELFYREGDWLMAVAVQPAPFRVTAPRKLFELPGATYNFDQNFADYDVAPDGRFLAIRRDNVVTDEINVVLNWTEELRRSLKR